MYHSVGFSFTENGDYVLHDNVTAHDALEFLTLWFQQYPEYVNNPFYIAGESYAGNFESNIKIS